MRLTDIMMEMKQEWNRRDFKHDYFKKYKAYKTRSKRADSEIINMMDFALEKHEELTEKEKQILKEFSLTVVNAFHGLIMDKMTT